MKTAREIFNEHFPFGLSINDGATDEIIDAMEAYRDQRTAPIGLHDVTDEQWIEAAKIMGFGEWGSDDSKYSIIRNTSDVFYFFTPKGTTFVEIRYEGSCIECGISDSGIFYCCDDQTRDYYGSECAIPINVVAIVDYLRSLGVQFTTQIQS